MTRAYGLRHLAGELMLRALEAKDKLLEAADALDAIENTDPEPHGLDPTDPPDPEEWRPPYTLEHDSNGQWCVMDRECHDVQAGLSLDDAQRLRKHFNSRASDAFAACGVKVEWSRRYEVWHVYRDGNQTDSYPTPAEAWRKAAELYREIKARPATVTLREAREQALGVMAKRTGEIQAAIEAERQADRDFEAAHPHPVAVRPTPLPREEIRVEQTGDLWAVLIPGRSLPALFYNPKMARQYAADIGRELAETNGKGVAG